MCRNRSVEILKDRPDLVDQIEKFRKKIDNVTKIICKVCKKNKINNFIFASSSSVYGDQKKFPIKKMWIE